MKGFLGLRKGKAKKRNLSKKWSVAFGAIALTAYHTWLRPLDRISTAQIHFLSAIRSVVRVSLRGI